MLVASLLTKRWLRFQVQIKLYLTSREENICRPTESLASVPKDHFIHKLYENFNINLTDLG